MYRFASFVVLCILCIFFLPKVQCNNEWSVEVANVTAYHQKLLHNKYLFVIYSRLGWNKEDLRTDQYYRVYDLNGNLMRSCKVKDSIIRSMSIIRTTAMDGGRLALTSLQVEYENGSNMTYLYAYFLNIYSCMSRLKKVLLNVGDTKVDIKHRDHAPVLAQDNSIEVIVESTQLCNTTFCRIKFSRFNCVNEVTYKAYDLHTDFSNWFDMLPINNSDSTLGYYYTNDAGSSLKIQVLDSNYTVTRTIDTGIIGKPLATMINKNLVICGEDQQERVTIIKCHMVNATFDKAISVKSYKVAKLARLISTSNGGFFILIIVPCNENNITDCTQNFIKLKVVHPDGKPGEEMHVGEFDSSTKDFPKIRLLLDEAKNKLCYFLNLRKLDSEYTWITHVKCFAIPENMRNF